MKPLALGALLLLAACTGSRWDAYDASSYDVVMEPSEEEYLEHIDLLQAWSQDEENPLPPGLYMELGYWLAKVERYDEARAAFEEEIRRYPYVEKYLAVLSSVVLEPREEEGSAARPGEPAVEPEEGEGE